MAYREIRKQLLSLGCSFYRQGKGSHEIWVNSHGFKFPIPRRKIHWRIAKNILNLAERTEPCLP